MQQILEAARLAPTAANRQPFQLIVIHTAGQEAALRRVYHRSWFSQAPLLICACALLKLPDDVEPVAFTPLGYPADQPQPKTRKSLSGSCPK